MTKFVKPLLFVCALMLAAVPVMAANADHANQHDVDSARNNAARHEAAAAADTAKGNTAGAAAQQAKADANLANAAARLAGCPTCH